MTEPIQQASGAKILVVEDSAPMRARIAWELAELTGIQEVLEAGDLPTALALLQAHLPEIAVVDLHLRADLAFPFLQMIREGSLPTVAIVYSNAAPGPLRDACLRLGARAFLPKSGGFEPVASAVSEILSSLPSPRPEHSAAPNSTN